MHMTFFWSTDIGEYFFSGLQINSVTSLAILCLILAIVSIVYEAIKVHSANVRARTAREQIAAVSCAPSETANLLVNDQSGQKSSFSRRFCRLFSEATIFLCHNTIGYALMLSVMVYSGWLFVTVVLSMGLGYFVFGHISMKINMENVQARTTTVICTPDCLNPANTATCNKNSSPCHSVSQQVTQNQVENPSGSTSPPPVPHAAIPVSCHQEKIVLKVSPETEDCSCRL